MNGFLTWLIHGSKVARRVNAEKVLRVLLVAGSPLSGFPLAQAAGISPTAVYVALATLERDGLVVSDWAPGPDWPSRPRRRMFDLTEPGRLRARQLLAETEL